MTLLEWRSAWREEKNHGEPWAASKCSRPPQMCKSVIVHAQQIRGIGKTLCGIRTLRCGSSMFGSVRRVTVGLFPTISPHVGRLSHREASYESRHRQELTRCTESVRLPKRPRVNRGTRILNPGRVEERLRGSTCHSLCPKLSEIPSC